jgi:antitoxin HicB
MAYPFEVRPLSSEEGGGFAISFPDLPGCWSDGETPEEAVKNGQDALAAWLAAARQFGDEVPKPFSAVSGRFVQRVPRSVHAALIARAESEGVSLNTLVVSLVAEGLGRREVGNLTEASSEAAGRPAVDHVAERQGPRYRVKRFVPAEQVVRGLRRKLEEGKKKRRTA